MTSRTWIERLQDLAARYPHAELDLSGGLSQEDIDDLEAELEGFARLDAGEGIDADVMIAKARDIVARARLASGRVGVHDALQGWQNGWIDDARVSELVGLDADEDVRDLYRWAVQSDVEMKLPPRPIVVAVPTIMSGDPCIMGTRVPAATVLAEIAAGADETAILDGYPVLPEGVVDAVMTWSKNT